MQESNMRVAVLEGVTAGLCGLTPDPALRREGAAMWRGLVEDLLDVPGVAVASLSAFPVEGSAASDPRCRVVPITDTAAIPEAWRGLVDSAERALIIAPETEGLLAAWVAALPEAKRFANATPAAITVWSDKLQSAATLAERGIPTIPTQLEPWREPPAFTVGPVVIKPRDGCGSWLVRRVADATQWQAVRDEYLAAGSPAALRQPYVRGTPASLAGWFASYGVDWLPVTTQHLSTDGRYEYLGGALPHALTRDQATALETLRRQLAALPGLRGYIGFDLLLTTEHDEPVVVVEVNPRLTTSYVGYRAWWTSSPWPSWLHGAMTTPKLTGRGTIRFTADGMMA
jgi:predicted ATP-grasp superfamily ATP-dependent carboligase